MNTINIHVLAAVREAVDLAGGPSNLARALEVTPQMVSQWISDNPVRNRPVAARHCKLIENLYGIGRRRLRPGDWHRYWPELADVVKEPAKEVA
ncbi:YdaS family helix-turn-helix protein [Burkholderia stagnalis]|uniref:transcriptional regulator n=1 Tax=Burkholderia stagnalis TaxID=1503054 RepID=UPI002AB4A025|nr:YdaS family helix-turn-helix protein [Burkholderia stagnalis]MDY7807577.1 YdaS family helix-turn-helix protein [Burkholderia stagnalis]